MGDGALDRHRVLDMLCDDAWKVMRKSLAPTFTAGKLKQMTEPFEAAINLTLTKLEAVAKAKDETRNIKLLFQEMALDTVAHCAFGVTVDRSHDLGSTKEDILLRFGREVSEVFTIPDAHYSRIQQLTYHLPWFERFYPFFGETYDNLFEYFKAIMTQRQASGDNRGDFMGRLKELTANLKTDPELRRMFSADTILAQASNFTLGGVETVAGVMIYLTYALMENPQIQEDLHRELSDCLEESGGVPDRDAINALPYLDACINECLRKYPPVTQHQRICNKDCVVEGIPIKKGMTIHIPIYASHMHEDFFENPSEFRPERFFKGEKESP